MRGDAAPIRTRISATCASAAGAWPNREALGRLAGALPSYTCARDGLRAQRHPHRSIGRGRDRVC